MSDSKFDLSVVALAFGAQSAAEEAFDTLTAEMLLWHAAGEFPSNSDVASAIKSGLPHLGAASLKVYASALLKWAKSGKTPRTIRAMVNTAPAGHIKGKGGRPAGKGAGKTTKTEAPAAAPVDADAAPVGTEALPGQWARYLEGVRAQAAAQKSWSSADIVALQDCATMMLAIIKRNRA